MAASAFFYYLLKVFFYVLKEFYRIIGGLRQGLLRFRSEEHTSELQSQR